MVTLCVHVFRGHPLFCSVQTFAHLEVQTKIFLNIYFQPFCSNICRPTIRIQIFFSNLSALPSDMSILSFIMFSKIYGFVGGVVLTLIYVPKRSNLSVNKFYDFL